MIWLEENGVTEKRSVRRQCAEKESRVVSRCEW